MGYCNLVPYITYSFDLIDTEVFLLEGLTKGRVSVYYCKVPTQKVDFLIYTGKHKNMQNFKLHVSSLIFAV